MADELHIDAEQPTASRIPIFFAIDQPLALFNLPREDRVHFFDIHSVQRFVNRVDEVVTQICDNAALGH